MSLSKFPKLFSTDRTRAVVSDRFQTTSIGTTLLLKAAGFVEDCRGRIIDINEQHLIVRIGPSHWRSLFMPASQDYPVEVELTFSPVERHLTINPEVRVDATIRQLSRLMQEQDFTQVSRRLMWQLRYHFMA